MLTNRPLDHPRGPVAPSGTVSKCAPELVGVKNSLLSSGDFLIGWKPFFMKTAIHPKYVDAEIRCACGNVIKTRSTRSTIIVGICNICHPFYTGQQKFVDTAGRVDKFQQRLAKTQAAQAEHATKKKKKV